MTPERFADQLQTLIAATRALALLPLEEMASYVDLVEALGRQANEQWTAERQETAAHAGRMVAAALHLRETTAMGGAS